MQGRNFSLRTVSIRIWWICLQTDVSGYLSTFFSCQDKAINKNAYTRTTAILGAGEQKPVQWQMEGPQVIL